jgi:hypothetical protein
MRGITASTASSVPCATSLRQLVVERRQEFLGGLRVALLDGGQDLGDAAHSGEDNRPEGGGQERTSDDRGCTLRSSRRLLDLRAQAEVPSALRTDTPEVNSR